MRRLKSTLAATLLTVLTSAMTSASTWISGGGQVVVDRSGQVRFLDMVPDSELAYVTHLTGLPAFAICTTKPFERMTLPDAAVLNVIAQWTSSLPALALVMNEQWEVLKYKTLGENTELEANFRDSERIHSYIQHTVGAFTGEFLVIDRRAFVRLSNQDQSAFLIHELLRQIAIMFDTENTLADIETMTPALVKRQNTSQLQALNRKLASYHAMHLDISRVEKLVTKLNNEQGNASDIKEFARLARAIDKNVDKTVYVSEKLEDRLSAISLTIGGIGFFSIVDTLSEQSRKDFFDAKTDIYLAESSMQTAMLSRGIFYQSRLNTIPVKLALEAMESNASRGYAYHTLKREWVQNCR